MSQLVKVAAAAMYLGVDRKTVLKYIHLKMLPAVQYGKRNSPWRIKDSDLREFMDKGRSHERTKSENCGTESLPKLDERAGS